MLSRIRRNHRNQHKFNGLWPWLVIILASLLILSPQIFGQHMIVGEDCWFHMNRTYEDMEQIRTGHFSYFLNLFSFNSSGRIVNAVYGPLGGYLEGLLLLIVKTWYRWEIVNSLVVLIGSGLSMYYVARKFHVTIFPSILTGVFYLASFPFDRWVLGQNFDGFGAMLLPWFILAGYRIYRHDFSPVKLAILVAIMSQLHLMSTLVGITSLLVSFILANFRSGRAKLWLKTVEAAGMCLLMTVNVWGAVIEVGGSNHVIPPVPYQKFLSMTHAIYGRMVEAPVINYVVIELFVFAILGLVWFAFRYRNTVTQFLTCQGLFVLWLISVGFPWKTLISHDPMLTSYLQFPERFMPIAIIALLLLFTQIRPKLLTGIFLLLLVVINIDFAFQNDQSYVGKQYPRLMTSTRNVTLRRLVSFQKVESSLHASNPRKFIQMTFNSLPDYMPSKIKLNRPYKYDQFSPYAKNKRDIINNHLPVHYAVADRDVAKLTFNAQPGRQTQLPFIKYRHTKVWLNHRLIKPKLNSISAIQIRPRRRHNVLEAQYHPDKWYEILIIGELFTWLSLIINVVIKHVFSRRV